MKQNAASIEPLLVPTLRLLVALPLTTILATLLIEAFLPAGMVALVPKRGVKPDGVPFLLAELITLSLLIIPDLSAKLGRWFLPITLFFCTLGPIGTLIIYVFHLNSYFIAQDIPQEAAFSNFQGIWPLIFFLTIPLIVVAWQYSFRWVVFYTLGLALVEVVVIFFLRLTWEGDVVPWTLLQFAIGRTVVFLANGYLVSRLVASQRQQRAALAQANSQLVQYALTQEQLAVSRERNRLARDLHDTLAHYMSGLVLELEGTRLLWEADSPQARTTLENAISTARNGLVETRRALQALRATPLSDLGFSGAVRDLAESMAARNQWQLTVDLPAIPIVLPTATDEVLYRIIQEGLTNIERHAGATVVTVRLQLVGEALHLWIEDNGCGFVPTAINTGEKFGLVGMQERSDLIGGKLAIRSAPGHGTKLALTFNYQQAPATSTAAPSPIVTNGKMESTYDSHSDL